MYLFIEPYFRELLGDIILCNVLWGNSHIIFKHSNLSPWKFATSFLINQDAEGETAEFTAIKAGRSSCWTDVRWQCGEMTVF